MFLGLYSCEPTPFNLSDDSQLYITEFLYAMKGIIMRNVILAVLFGLFISSVATAAPSQPSCRFRTISGRIAFTKDCDADARSSITKAVKALKTRYTIREDLKAIKDSAESFYQDHCTRPVADYKALAKRMLKDSRRGYKVKNGKRVKVKPLSRKFKKTLRKYARVNAEKATPMTWKMCYNNLPSHKQMHEMMLPKMARRTFVWHKCSDIKDRHDFARCAWKAASNKDGAAEKAITEVIEAYLELRFQKEEAKVIIRKKTGGCELAAFGRLKCASSAGLLLAAMLMFLLGRLQPQLRVVIGIAGFIIGLAVCLSDANAEKLECTSLETLREMSKEEPIGARMRFQASKAIASVFTDLLGDPNASKEVKKVAVKAMKKLFCDSIGDNPEIILGAMKAANDFFNRKELLEAIELRLEALEIQEGSCGGFLIVILYGLLGLLGGCRSRLLVVLVALGSMTSLADAAAKRGCSLDSNENIIELFEGSCSPEVLQSLIEEVGLVCTEEHRMEGASLSMAAPTEQGLSQEADLRHRFLEALCWSETD